MPILRFTILALYFLTMGALATYGVHRVYLLCLLRKHRSRLRAPCPDPDPWPVVTVQIPTYNEYNVAPRLIEAVCRLDYPRERLEIQVLDDSTDATRARIVTQVAQLRAQGYDIHCLQRETRTGFKAGALAAGLARARGEFIAIFDADFLPGPAFLRETISSFADPRVGMVQARWGHLNRECSTLTRVQALLLDGHFLIEHAARYASGRFFNFNGTAGVWRRRCIEDAGGWQNDTLTEDLDLSYRAQLVGWRFVFLPSTVAPAELPVEISAFKCQQHRWAKGSIQTARKLLPTLLRAPLPLAVRAEGVFHMTANFAHVLMVLLAMLLFPAMLVRLGSPWQISLALDLPLFLFSTLAFWAFYVAAEIEAHGRASRALRTMPALMAVGVGLSLNNARAVLEGLFGGLGTFERTPKHGIEDGRGPAPALRYRTARTSRPWIEGLFSVYFTVCIVTAAWLSLWAFLPFLILFWAGFTHMTVTSLAEAIRLARAASNAPPAQSQATA